MKIALLYCTALAAIALAVGMLFPEQEAEYSAKARIEPYVTEELVLSNSQVREHEHALKSRDSSFVLTWYLHTECCPQSIHIPER